MFCNRCGAKIPEGGRFCVNCGAPVAGIQPRPAAFQGEPKPVRFFSFGESVKNYFKGYVDFKGRATRAEFWWAFLFTTVIGVVLFVIEFPAILGAMIAGYLSLNPTYADLFPYMIPSYILMFALIIPSLALYWRRLHDTGRSGLYFLFFLIPIAGFVLMIVFGCQQSDADNKYGPRKTE